jgi:hypothetical protein
VCSESHKKRGKQRGKEWGPCVYSSRGPSEPRVSTETNNVQSSPAFEQLGPPPEYLSDDSPSSSSIFEPPQNSDQLSRLVSPNHYTSSIGLRSPPTSDFITSQPSYSSDSKSLHGPEFDHTAATESTPNESEVQVEHVPTSFHITHYRLFLYSDYGTKELFTTASRLVQDGILAFSSLICDGPVERS